jgi:curved DNA-binding protein CbpA
MNNPYLILRVPPEAGDAEIRRAYLDGVREFPPEREPERFQAIARAYELIRDEPARLRYYLFHREPPGATPGETFANFCAAALVPQPLPFEEMKAFLRACSTT